VFTFNRLVPFVVKSTDVSNDFSKIGCQDSYLIDCLNLRIASVVINQSFVDVKNFSTDLDDVVPEVLFDISFKNAFFWVFKTPTGEIII
jgi:hypothetical protein